MCPHLREMVSFSQKPTEIDETHPYLVWFKINNRTYVVRQNPMNGENGGAGPPGITVRIPGPPRRGLPKFSPNTEWDERHSFAMIYAGGTFPKFASRAADPPSGIE